MNATQNIKYRFDPSSAQASKVLGPLESDIMAIVWQQGPTTVGAVHKALREHKDIAYTTVMTTMTRLAKKNMLQQDKSTSSYTYSPTLGKSDFERYVITGIIHALIADYGDTFVDCFVEVLGEISPVSRRLLADAVCEEA